MKSNICTLTTGAKDQNALSAILDETEKCASYNGLGKKETGRLRLLSEELVGMLPELLSFTNGEFWVEAEEKSFELHTRLTPTEAMTSDKREELLKISSSGKNAAATGIMAKIRLAAELMLIDYEANASMLPAGEESFYGMGATNSSLFSGMSWSLDTYRKQAEEKKGEDWDELEKSIVANIADDVTVGITGKSVEIVVKKAFA